jgi:signal transduction histidine kinase/CheY-like chemotaxis protein
MIVTADVFDFLIVLLPAIFLTHFAFRISLAQGKSRGAILLLVGDSLIVFSFLFKMYFDFTFGSVDTFWLFILNLGTAIGLIFAFAGANSIYSFLFITRAADERLTSNAVKIAGISGIVFSVLLILYFMTLRQPIYWRLAGLCFVISQIALFGIGILVAEFFHLVGKRAATGARRVRIIAAYYLIEPLVWWGIVRDFQGTIPYPLLRIIVNFIGIIVSSLFVISILQYMRLYLPANLRNVKTTYLDMLRIKVLRDFYIIGICVVTFMSFTLLAARYLYEDVRLSTIKNYAELGLSACRLEAAEVRGILEDVVLRLQKSQSSQEPDSYLKDLLKNKDYIDAIGDADENSNITFLFKRTTHRDSDRVLITDEDVANMLRSTVSTGEGDVKLELYDKGKGAEYFILIKGRGKYEARPYVFAVLSVKQVVSSSSIYLDGLSVRLISPALKVIYSSHENEVGEDFQKVFLSSDKISAEDLRNSLRSITTPNFNGYGVLKGYNQSGIGEYLVLIAAPIEFQGYNGFLAAVEPEQKISGLFRPTNSLLLLSGFLIVGLFSGGILIMSVAFRWSMRLEREVQNKIQELRSSEDKYRRIVENPYIGSFIMVDGRVIFSNSRLAEILEIDVDRLSGSDLSVFVDNKDYVGLRGIFDSIIRGEKFGDKWQVSGTTASGRSVRLSGYSTVINIGNKKGIQSLVVDSTAEFREKEKLEQFERLESMATLAAGIAHDFNNILQVVLGSAQLLQHKLKEAELRKYADNITNVAIRGSDLSRRLLTFSRQKGLEERRRFDVNEIILESLPLFEETFPRTIKIETKLDAEPIFIEGDQSQIQQVIFNLAVNARDAMPHGGTLTLKTEVREVSSTEAEVYQASQGTYAYIEVKDNGEGIPPELMSKVFEPFFTTKPPGKGTGLGLSVVYGIVRSHGGFLKVYSEVKKGTVFNIYLPLAGLSIKTTESAGTVREKLPAYGAKILFVDDEAGIREAAEFLLEQAGYEVLTAKDGISAIDIYRKEWKNIDLVVLDLNMPELSGREVLENFTIINPDVRVLISTGYITKDERAGLRGIVEVLEKPFDFDQLLSRVRSALSGTGREDVSTK